MFVRMVGRTNQQLHVMLLQILQQRLQRAVATEGNHDAIKSGR